MLTRLRNRVSREIKRYHRRGVPYQPDTTFLDPKGANWYEPLLIGPSTVAGECASAATIRSVMQTLEALTPEPFAAFTTEFYRTGLSRFGDNWRYADLVTVLHGLCRQISVESYLEIGVRRGRSMAMVAALHPDATIVGFDRWIPGYVGVENPGPDFVRGELAKVEFRGQVDLVTGDSRKTVREYFRRHPDLYFDLATVDGDHSARGAAIDIRHVIPRLKIGGVLVFDDICNVEHTYLRDVWDKEVARSGRFATYAFDELGYGVAFGIRKY